MNTVPRVMLSVPSRYLICLYIKFYYRIPPLEAKPIRARTHPFIPGTQQRAWHESTVSISTFAFYYEASLP